MVPRREDSGNGESYGANVRPDFGQSGMRKDGRRKGIVNIRPLDSYGEPDAGEQPCETCGLTDGSHDFRKHRTATDKTIEGSVARHPAGRGLRRDEDNGDE